MSTDQYQETGVVLNSYGPQPVLRGGTLRFLGTNLDKVTEVILPGAVSVTEINVIKAGVPSEIQITVPVEGPEPGLITLKTAEGQEIVTKTELTYSEPIVLESFAPAAVAAGDVLTLKGDYFNLIHEVIFSDKVYVSEKDFLKHTRYEIQVKVPVEARTGKIAVGDLDELNNEDPNLMANTLFSETELTVAQPEVTKMEAARYKAGETVKITGKNFQYVAALNLPGAEGVAFTADASNTQITFVLPAEAQDGEAVLVAKSGVEVVAGKYETVIPTEVAAAPQPVKAGATLTVTGKDLDLVTGVQLPGADYVEYVNEGDITFTMPDTATEGDAVLHMANGKSVTTAYTLVKPEVTEYSANPASAGSDMTIIGTDLDLVKSVTFGGDLTVEVEATAEAITVAVPTTAETGVLKLNLANGTSVECEELKVDKPVACYITELPGADVEVRGGTVLTVPVANEDKLTGVQVNGKDVDYILNKTQLYISLPQMAGAGTVITLISSNGSVEYVIDCIPDTVIETVVMGEMRDLGSWAGEADGGAFRVYKADLTAAGFAPGVILKFYVAQTAFAQLQINDANWGTITMPQYNAGEAPAVIEVPVDQAFYDKVMGTSDGWSDTGLVVQGAGLVVSKVTVYYEISLETTIWDKGFVISGWNGCQDLAWGGFDWTSVKAGQKLRFYCTPNDPSASWWCISLRVGDSWGALNGVPGQYDNPSVLEVELTQEILDHLLSANGMVITGDGCTVTKITIE